LGTVWELATPKNITYIWGLGSFLGVTIVLQVVSGILLAFYYVSGVEAWSSIVELTREVRWGWLLRLLHSNIASFVFVIMFAHITRGAISASFYLYNSWVRGWLIILMVIAAAFLGYVLPWGQISFWGATVIINLLRVLPSGRTLVVWLWGGFYVSNFTCRFFFSLHYVIPFIVLLLAGVHLYLLHSTGRSNPRGLRERMRLKIKFIHLFTIKDIVNMSLFWLIWRTMLSYPDWSADAVNFTVSDLSSSPLHIQPEWYFLHLYAILRRIPSKVGGLVAFAIAVFFLLVLILVNSIQRIKNILYYNYSIWRFLATNSLLVWLGIQGAEAPFILIGQVASYVYFLMLSIVVVIDLMLVQLYK